MKYTDCPLCSEPHHPAGRCRPGRRRNFEIDFPPWVKITECELRRETRCFDSRHGRVKFVTFALTPHGHVMKSFRDRNALATVDQPTVIHRSRMRAAAR